MTGAFEVLAELDASPTVRPPSKRRKARPVTEDTVKQGVLALVKLHGGYAIVKHQTGLSVAGTPDVLACIGGRFVAIEIKRVGNIPTPTQLGQLRLWQKAGALACWVDEVRQLNDVLEHLDDYAWRNDFEHPGDGRHAGDPW